MAASNHIVKVAVVGAGGHVGKHIVEALLDAGKHQVTAVTRKDSKSTLPSGVDIARVDYSDHSSLVDALKGHDALIITISVTAHGEQERLIRAASDADVPWILPNQWGFDSQNEAIVHDLGMGEVAYTSGKLISELGKSSYIYVSTGFWIEWSYSFPDGFGFDFENKTVTLYGEGETRMTVSSWPQVGRAVAGLLSLKIRPDGPDDKEASLQQFKNTWAYPISANVSQKDLLASVLRVTNTTERNWTIKKEPAEQRYSAAMEEVKKGNFAALTRAMYARGFFPDEPANVERWRGGSHNSILGLQEEDIDQYTKAGIERSKEMAQWLKSVHR